MQDKTLSNCQLESSICFQNKEEYEEFLQQEELFEIGSSFTNSNEKVYKTEELRENGFIAFADGILQSDNE